MGRSLGISKALNTAQRISHGALLQNMENMLVKLETNNHFVAFWTIVLAPYPPALRS